MTLAYTSHKIGIKRILLTSIPLLVSSMINSTVAATAESQSLQLPTGSFFLSSSELIQSIHHALAKTQTTLSTNSSENQSLVEVNEILSHPFLVLLVSATATGLLFPYLTNRWQKHQKQHELEFQLKVDLMKRINESVNETVMTAIFAFRSRSISNDKITEVYRKWELSSAELESDIKVYFPQTTKSNIAKSWADYFQYLKEFYFMTVNSYRNESSDDISLKEQIENSINKMRDYVYTLGIDTDIEWEDLLSHESIKRYNGYTRLAKWLMDKKGEIIGDMFKTPTLIFQKKH
jgi:NADH:ubiquinone oxidoreductase subunit 5 (subunit L)/multisubunit Na+/H+ antiporter MnhA subunit